tara:strand:+ start:1114 stop:2043 length:930 start_codon:yes stop_codon:yes gene_type:complete
MQNDTQSPLFFQKEWDKIEDVKTYPHYLRNVVILEAEDFVEKVTNASQEEAQELVKSIYSGDAYILKNALSPEFVEDLKNRVIEWGKTKEDKYFQMKDGVQSYRFTNKGDRKPEGGYTEVVHSHIFFRWDDELELFRHFDKYWSAFKVLSGQSPTAYLNNKPTDGIIDRITLMQYPVNHGRITHHYDSPRRQKMLLGGIFSQIGEDYDGGNNGFYVMDKEKRKYFLENLSRKGDLICVYPAMYHGVATVKKAGFIQDEDKDLFESREGRFYLQCFSAESHEVVNRGYSVAIKDKAGHGPVANYIGGPDG